MNKGIKAALALGLCCVTAAGLFGCTKAAPEETTQFIHKLSPNCG